MEDGPFDQVGRRAAQAAGRTDDGQPPEGLLVAVHGPDVHFAALALEGVGEGGPSVGECGAEAFAVEGRFVHPERLEDALAHVLCPALAGELLDDHRGGDEGDVIILVVAAEGVGGRHELQHVVDVVAVVAQVAQVGADVVAQAGPVRGQVLDLDVLADPGIVHFKVGEMLFHAVFPTEESLVHKLGQHGSREGFGDRSDLEERVRVHRRAGIEVLDPVSFGQDDVPVFVDRHAHAGNLPVGTDLFDGAFNVGDDFLLRKDRMARGNVFRGLGGRCGGQEHDQGEEEKSLFHSIKVWKKSESGAKSYNDCKKCLHLKV